MVSRVEFPDLNTPSTLLRVSLPSGANGSGGSGRRSTAASAAIAILAPGTRPRVSVMRPALSPPRVEPILEGEPHVPRTVQVPHDERVVHQAVVASELRAVPRPERGEHRARGVDARLHRVVDPLERGDVHETGRAAQEADARAVAALRDRGVAPFG